MMASIPATAPSSSGARLPGGLGPACSEGSVAARFGTGALALGRLGAGAGAALRELRAALAGLSRVATSLR